jgi:TonB family protein
VKDFILCRIVSGRISAAAFLALMLVGMPVSFLTASTSQPSSSRPLSRTTANLERRERQLSRTLTRATQFADVPHASWRWSCEQVGAPVALATPDPFFTSTSAGYGKKVRVSFIIGTDGRVHSPLILESAGAAGDRHVLDTVRHWRYRPATCNGVPTETEGKIEFSIR